MGAGGGLTMGLAQSVLAAEGVRAGRGGGWALLALAGPCWSAMRLGLMPVAIASLELTWLGQR